jgi:hypothetical protein
MPFLGAFDDQISSVYNNSRSWACLYMDPGYHGNFADIPPGK